MFATVAANPRLKEALTTALTSIVDPLDSQYLESHDSVLDVFRQTIAEEADNLRALRGKGPIWVNREPTNTRENNRHERLSEDSGELFNTEEGTDSNHSEMSNQAPIQNAQAEGGPEDMRGRSRMRGRRAVVFGESVHVDADWEPPVVEKTPEEHAFLVKELTSNILFSGMDHDSIATMASAMQKMVFQEGDVIIKQGDVGDYYYIIAEGNAVITVNGATVLHAKPGMGFGELALLYGAPRAATVTASGGPVSTWAMDRLTFKSVVMGTIKKKREKYEGFLRQVPILATLTESEILTLADALEQVHVEAGTVVVYEGDTDVDRFYIVEDGELAATIEGVEGEVCSRLTAGTYFGERALLTDEPRAATITAIKDSRLLAMDRASFNRIMGPLHTILARNVTLYSKYCIEK